MTGVRSPLRLQRQAAPATPASGFDALYSSSAYGQVAVKSPAGTVRNLQYEHVYNVRDYGATGNGTTDDAAAIQAALDLASSTNPGSTLWFPPGTYKVNSELEIKGSVSIVMDEACTVIRGVSTMQYVFRNFNSSYAPTGYNGRGMISFTGGVIDGGGASFTTTVTNVIIAHADTVTFDNVTFQNVVDWHGLELNSTRNAKVRDCTFQGFRLVTAGRDISEACQIDLAKDATVLPGIGAGAFDNTPCTDVTITGCTVRGLGTLGAFGCLTGSHSWTDGFPHTNIRIIGNHADGLSHYMVAALNWSNVTVVGNTCQNSNGFMSILLPSSGATADIFRFTVAANVVYNMGIANQAPSQLTECFLIDGNDASGAGNVVRDCIVEANSFHTITNATACISTTNVADLVIVGNSLKTVSGIGLNINMSRSAQLSENKFSSITGRCIYLTDGTNGSSTRSKIGGNVMDGFSDYGIETQSTGVSIIGNHLNDPATSGKACIRVAGTDAVVECNTLWRGGGSASSNGIEIASTSTSSYLTGNRMKGWATTTSTAASAVTGTAVWAVSAVVLDPAIASFTTSSINKINTTN